MASGSEWPAILSMTRGSAGSGSAPQRIDPGTVSISVPNDPLISSTLSGDVLINSQVNFNNNTHNLLTALLHEAGHVLGIGDNSDPNSPMNSQDLGSTQLTDGDFAALQALYGSRAPDPHEGSGGNDRIDTATTIQAPGGSGSYTGATPLISYGDVTTNQDLDFYAFKAPNDYTGPVTIQLRSAGISLLNPHLTLLDAGGHVLGDVQSASNTGDVVDLHLDRVDPNANYYIEVQGTTGDVFGIGSYGVAVTFDANSTVTSAAIDSVLRGPYQSLSPNDINSIFLEVANPLFNSANRTNDTPGTATQLTPSPGYARNSHYELVGSVSGPADSRYYRIQTADNPPGGQALVLTVTARALDVNGTAPRVTILDGNRNFASQQILANGGGMFTVQASGLSGGGSYVIQASPNTSIGSPTTGNYALMAQFGTTAAHLSSHVSNTLPASAGSMQSYSLYVGESQLMHLILSASAVGGPAAPDSAIRMTMLDASGNVEYSLTAAAGDTVSGAAGRFLLPGAYTIQFIAMGASSDLLAYDLLGDEISDPIGTVLSDPTLTPFYPAPLGPPWFLYPVGVLTTAPFFIAPTKNVVTTPPPTLVSISVTSSSPTVAMGSTTQFIATGIRSDNSTVDLTNQVAWSSSVAGVATLSPAGMATALTSGQVTVVASFQGLRAYSVLTVSEPSPVSVRSVSLILNKRHMVNQIRVTFSGAVNIAQAQTAGVYRLTTPGKKGSFAARNGVVIPLGRAVYDVSHHEVIVTVRKPFAITKPLQLLINGSAPSGLHDSFGRPIDGDQNGIAGGNAVVVIKNGTVTLRA